MVDLFLSEYLSEGLKLQLPSGSVFHLRQLSLHPHLLPLQPSSATFVACESSLWSLSGKTSLLALETTHHVHYSSATHVVVHFQK